MKNNNDKLLDKNATQRYSCVMLPDLIDIGAPWRVLPPGIHKSTIRDVEVRFAISEHRKHLFSGFKTGVIALRKAGCKTIFLDGSFVTEKSLPKDYDVCWHPKGVNINKLDPVFLDFSQQRKNQKLTYYGEYFPASSSADGLHNFLEYFQIDRYTGKSKGIISICIS